MGKLYITVSVDWEGEDFSGVKALQQVRHELEKSLKRRVPFTHFICPSYFTDGHARAVQQIRSCYDDDIDEVGLHVHCWQSLVEAAGLRFVETADFHANTERAGTGHGVPVGAYGDQAYDLLKYSAELLAYELELDSIDSFRCGGWLASDPVLRALMKLGIAYDSSAGPPAQFSKGYNKNSKGNGKDGFGESNGVLVDHMTKIWGYRDCKEPHLANSLSRAANGPDAIHWKSQPYEITEDGKSLIEFPIALMSDYVKAATLWPEFESLLSQSYKSSEPLFFHIGCHQEGDMKYKRTLVEFLAKLAHRIARDKQAAKTIEFVTLRDAGKVWSMTT